MESVGEDMYIAASPDTYRRIYVHKGPSPELSDLGSFLNAEFPLADFLIMETVQLNEFFDHQTAQNTMIVMTEKMLMDVFFEKIKERFSSVLFAPKADDLQRYGINNTIIIEKLSTRYPKNPRQRHSHSIEKLTVDLFAERTIRAVVNANDRPAALETIFKRYRINETRLFNYARTRRVDAEIRRIIRNDTAIKLYTEKGNR
ncbi:MAG: hypothetical protein FWG58_03885 [Methanomassiliicoccaceae archaeon]|nr:hypothetical protein [Methanomassiliicoccaceae archaeon]